MRTRNALISARILTLIYGHGMAPLDALRAVLGPDATEAFLGRLYAELRGEAR